jgi:plastocyanin
MVFAVNCPQDGSPNSFTNFKQAALAIGAAEASATPTSTANADSSSAPAAYGGSGGNTNSGSPAPTSVSAPAAVHTVLVGDSGSLAFNPSSIQANPSDTVVFELYVCSPAIFHTETEACISSSRQKNHTVTQSSFADPCSPLNTNSVPGFDSGL